MELAEIKKMNIFERMAAITAELEPVAKDLQVGSGDKAYQATKEGTILKAVKPLESKYRIYSYPASREKETTIIEKEYEWNGERRKVRLVKVDVTVQYRFVNMDAPDECVEMTSYGTGLDTGDKAPGKAMTYADKYALMKAYKISTGVVNDPDSYMSPEDGFIFGLSDMPNADNPLDYSPQGKSAPSSGAAAQQSLPPQSPPPVSAPQPADTGVMTDEDARQVVVPIGHSKGMTLGEVLATSPSLIEFYAGPKFNSEKYPYLKTAAQALLACREGRN